MKQNKKILIVVANFYESISNMLITAAKDRIEEYNHLEYNITYDIKTVPGALEIAPLISMIINKNNYNGFIAFGCIIRGDTTHYDHVCTETFRGLGKLTIKYKVPIINGVLTVENEAQANERADKNKQNKAGVAVDSCIIMMNLQDEIQ